jgi:DNA-binding GntR family transcriptional regulator
MHDDAQIDDTVVPSLTLRLRDDIMLGNLRIGEWLRQIDIQERYDVPRFAVRQALSELTVMGFVEHVANRGFRVVNFSLELREDLTETRLILELASVDLLVASATDADIAESEAAAQAFDHAVEHGSYSEMQRLNHAFHKTLIQPIRNVVLKQQINDLRERNISGGSSTWSSVAKSSVDHVNMVAALRQRNSDALREVIRRHLTRWRDEP